MVGQQGWALTGLGGWANRLICAGAGLFSAPLWSVTDANALIFAKTFYAALSGRRYRGRSGASEPADRSYCR